MKKQLLIPLAAVLLLAGCSTAAQTAELSVKTEKVRVDNFETTIDIAGVFAPFRSENISTKTSGIVREIRVDVGDTVASGDAVVMLEMKELEAQLNQAEAALEAAKDRAAIEKTNLDAADVGVSAAKSGYDAVRAAIGDQVKQAKLGLESAQSALDSAIRQNDAQLAQARLALKTAQENYNQIKTLFDLEEASKVELDRAKDALDSAQNQLELAQTLADSALSAAQSKLDSAKSAYDQATGSSANSQLTAAKSNLDSAQSKAATARRQYEASGSSAIMQAEAAVEIIKVQLDNSVMSAHIPGVVVNKNIHEGELAQPGSPLITVSDVSRLKLSGTVSQEAIPYIKKGQIVDVYADIYPNDAIQGKVESVGPASVSTGSWFPVEISVDNARNLLPGVSAHATLKAVKQNAVIVPKSALIENDGKTYVFEIKNGISYKRDVLTGFRDGAYVEIISGLAGGEDVAVTNTNTLFDQKSISD